jgi:hypothetical protein
VVSELEHCTCARAPEAVKASPMKNDTPPSKAAFLDFITGCPNPINDPSKSLVSFGEFARPIGTRSMPIESEFSRTVP